MPRPRSPHPVPPVREHQHGAPDSHDGLSVAEYWERRYADGGPVWSGRPNAALVATAPAPFGSGRGLDLACGEGADAVWLAEQGWAVTAVDISAIAVDRGRAAAAERGVGDAITWVAADLETWQPPAALDLVTACFLQSSRELDRDAILRRAAGSLAVGGRLISIAHAHMPPWSAHADDEGITPERELAMLAADPAAWQVEIAEIRGRDVVGPDGEPATLQDSVVRIRRIAAS
jgi:SAM-dependent methyltransferase